MFNSIFTDDLSQSERSKRHWIFLYLISFLRNARLEQKDGFSHLVFDLQRLNHSQNFGNLDNENLWKLRVCSIPNFILNALICEKLTSLFGDLSVCNCFYKINGFWRLDIDERLSKRGLLLPLTARSNGLIYALKVFRYPDDKKPFTLKLR